MSVVLCFCLLGGCAGKRIQSLDDQKPILKPEKFFDGHVTGYGFSETRFGSIRNWFEADFHGETTGDTSIWQETLTYDDGRVEKRTWEIVRKDKHRYDVEATGMVGSGSGVAYGNAVRWNYHLNQTLGGTDWTFWVDDWMYKMDKNTLIVRATFSYFGITVGRGYIFLRKTQ